MIAKSSTSSGNPRRAIAAAATSTTSSTSHAPALNGSSFATIVNGDFNIANPADSAFGWSTTGTVTVDSGQALLSENQQAFSGLTQTFVIPAGATALQFTLSGLNLAPNTLAISDAFEVALLNDSTGNSLLTPITGLPDTDALLNIQQTGEVYFTPGVTFAGASTSGQVTALNTPLVFTVGLGGVAANTTATLYFDLLGFGATGSTARIDNVQLIGLEGDELPIANNDTATISENGLLVVTAPGILANDTDADIGDTKNVVAVNDQSASVGPQITLASGAHLTVQADGSYAYDPNNKFEFLRVGQTATDSFIYTMADSAGATSSATVTITIQGANDAPQAVADTATTTENDILIVSAAGVLANDTDADVGDTKTVTAINGSTAAVGTEITLPSGALLTMQADGGYRYDTNGKFDSLRAGQTATDSFIYTLADGAGAASSATVTITIQGVNDPPHATSDTASTGENQILTVAATGLLANDTDTDAGDTKTVVAVNGQSAAVGSQLTLPSGAVLTVQADGGYTYDPSDKFDSLRVGQTAKDTLTYTLADGTNTTSTANVIITILGANDLPVAVNDLAATAKSAVLIVSGPGVLANDTDVDADDTKTVTAINGVSAAVGTQITLASGALLTAQADGSYHYDPNGKFDALQTGQIAFDSFTYTLSDGADAAATATVTITILGSSNEPIAAKDIATTGENDVLLIPAPGVLANDAGISKLVVAVNDQPASVGSQITLASGAVLTLQSDGSYRYDPNNKFESLRAGQTTTDSFTYTLSDTTSLTSTATVTITIQGANDAPQAVADTAQTSENQPLIITAPGLLANDTDTDSGDTKTVTSINGQPFGDSHIILASRALLIAQPDGGYIYNPNNKFEPLPAGQTATDSFTYTMTDGTGSTSSATVTITIQGENDAPQAVNDSALTGENQILTISAFGLLSNDTDVDNGDTKTVSAINGQPFADTPITLPSGALLIAQPTGGYTYNRNNKFESLRAGQTATDSFIYTVTDGSGATSSATVTITIQGENDPPSAVNDSATTRENQILTITAPGLLSNDTDADTGDTKTITAINSIPAAVGTQITLASGALLTVQATGGYTYNPDNKFESLRAGQSATDSFTYTMTDGSGITSSATVTITIQGENDSPSAMNDTAQTTENQILTIGAPDLLSNDTDSDTGDTKTITAINGVAAAVETQITLASGALLTVQPTGGYTYNPNNKFESLRIGQTATDSFTYTMTDGAAGTSTATVTITIQGDNDAPIAVNDTGSTDENTVLVIAAAGLLANDTDADAGDTKTIIAINGNLAAVGTQIVLGSGALLTLQANGAYRYDSNGKFASLNNGQTATDTFSYTISDGPGSTAAATVTITILGITQTNPTLPNSISGTVFIDVNNNGLQGSLEMGLRYVMIHLDGPVSRTVQTDLDGHYAFTNLPAGVYSIRESHPQAFIDGIDTRGTPALGTVANDIFTGILLTSNVQAVAYNFAERGLTNPNKKLDLASTSLDWDSIQPRLPDDQLDTLWAQLYGPPPTPSIYSFQNPRNSLDVNDDGDIAPDDVLAIINRINAGAPPIISGAELRSPLIAAPYLDTTGDGVVAADDVLRVINYLNSRSLSAEGESTSSANSASIPLSTDLDSLLNLLAEDIDQTRRKK